MENSKNFLANPVFVVKSEIKLGLNPDLSDPPLPPCPSPRTESSTVSLSGSRVFTQVTPEPHLHTHSLPPPPSSRSRALHVRTKTRICHPAPSERETLPKSCWKAVFTALDDRAAFRPVLSLSQVGGLLCGKHLLE